MKQEETRCNEAIQLYNTTQLSITKIAKLLKLDRGRLSIEMKKCGLNIVNVHNSVKFDNTVFDVIDTEEKAYWLGFLYADGSISKGESNVIELSLSLKDITHLQKYNSFIKNTVNIKQDQIRCRCVVSNKHMKQTLISIGCIPNKSFVLKYPIIPFNLNNHFIRGYFDGDGYIGINPPSIKNRLKTPHVQISLLGTESMLTSILTLTRINKKLYFKKGNNPLVRNFIMSRKEALKFLDFIYKDATIYLERKYTKYLIAKNIQKYQIARLNRNI